MKVKPFYIRFTEEMTPQIIQDAIDRCVDAGAFAEGCIKGTSMNRRYRTEYHIYCWDSFGVNINGETCLWSAGNGTDNGKFGGIKDEITLDQLDEWLGIDKTETPEEKEVFDSMANNSELPNGSEWDGEGLPPVGTMLDGVKIMSCDGVKEWHCKPHWKVVGHHMDGGKFFVEPPTDGSIQAFPVGSNQYRPIETPPQREERERLEAAYDLYMEGQQALYSVGFQNYEQFVCDDVQTKFFLAIVDKTGYRKAK